MDLKEIKELIALMRKNDLAEFQLEQEGFKIKLKRGVDFPAPTVGYVTQPPHIALPGTAGAAPGASMPPPAEKEALREITSPMVGTFYASPSPDKAPYVAVGQEVAAGAVVCIIEAMKVMNEIKAEVSGTIAEIVAENGKPVQFGQVLFRVK